MDAGNWSVYFWSTGATSRKIIATNEGTYSVTVTDSLGCKAPAPEQRIHVFPLPVKPLITASDSSLLSSAPLGNQWYYADTLIPGANKQIHIAKRPGNYTVEISDNNNCSKRSEIYKYVPATISGIRERTRLSQFDYRIIPNPGNGIFSIGSDKRDPFAIRVFDMLGRLVYENTVGQGQHNLSALPKGTYVLQLQTDKESTYKKLVFQ